jgi:Replication-relaxation
MTPLSDEPVQKPLILNSKEERILQVVHDYECVTLEEINHLLFAKGSRTHVGAILRKLSGGRDYDDQQFLYRFPLPIAAKGTKARVYCLGVKAWEVLAIEDAYRPAKFRHLAYSPILHDLILSRFLTVATTYFAVQSDYKLLETRTCYELTSQPPRLCVNQNGQKATIAVIPDAWLDVERVSDGKAYPLWVEIDRGTENRRKFQQLVRNRLALVNSPQYEQLFHTTAVRFCYVTTGATPELGDIRLHNMLRWTEELLPKEEGEEKKESQRQQLAAIFRFTTVEYPNMYEQPHALFTEPVWYQPLVPDQVPLFD